MPYKTSTMPHGRNGKGPSGSYSTRRGKNTSIAWECNGSTTGRVVFLDGVRHWECAICNGAKPQRFRMSVNFSTASPIQHLISKHSFQRHGNSVNPPNPAYEPSITLEEQESPSPLLSPPSPLTSNSLPDADSGPSKALSAVASKRNNAMASAANVSAPSKHNKPGLGMALTSTTFSASKNSVLWENGQEIIIDGVRWWACAYCPDRAAPKRIRSSNGSQVKSVKSHLRMRHGLDFDAAEMELPEYFWTSNGVEHGKKTYKNDSVYWVCALCEVKDYDCSGKRAHVHIRKHLEDKHGVVLRDDKATFIYRPIPKHSTQHDLNSSLLERLPKHLPVTPLLGSNDETEHANDYMHATDSNDADAESEDYTSDDSSVFGLSRYSVGNLPRSIEKLQELVADREGLADALTWRLEQAQNKIKSLASLPQLLASQDAKCQEQGREILRLIEERDEALSTAHEQWMENKDLKAKLEAFEEQYAISSNPNGNQHM